MSLERVAREEHGMEACVPGRGRRQTDGPREGEEPRQLSDGRFFYFYNFLFFSSLDIVFPDSIEWSH